MVANPEDVTAYPLCWPHGQVRTPADKQARPNFSTKGVGGQSNTNELLRQIRMMGGQDIIISSNVPVRQDGQPYADAARRIIRDSGVAVYFIRKRQPVCFACDRWESPAANIRAIAMTIEALRGIARWGSAEMLDRAFSGYLALPAPAVTPAPRSWREIMGYDDDFMPDLRDVRVIYLDRCKSYHPDGGGTHDLMAEVNRAWAEAQDELGQKLLGGRK